MNVFNFCNLLTKCNKTKIKAQRKSYNEWFWKQKYKQHFIQLDWFLNFKDILPKIK